MPQEVFLPEIKKLEDMGFRELKYIWYFFDAKLHISIKFCSISNTFCLEKYDTPSETEKIPLNIQSYEQLQTLIDILK